LGEKYSLLVRTVCSVVNVQNIANQEKTHMGCGKGAADLDASDSRMARQHQIVILIILFLVTACGLESSPPVGPDVPATPTAVQENYEAVMETLVPTATVTSIETAAPLPETSAPNCLGNEVSPVGQSIADDYNFVSYEQVMTWFCNGAEFEDILVALETESQTGTPAGEMLQMLADGFTWDEIWQSIGLTQ
jgi:hypothetical protein